MEARAAVTPDENGWLPGWAPYAIFGLLTVFLFREFIISRGMLFGTDVILLGYFARKWYADMITQVGTFPLWDPYVFGGLPFVDAMHGDIFYPTTVLNFFMPVHRGMGWKLVLHVFLAGVFTYGWLRHLKVSRPIATFGGATYLLAPVMVSLIYPGHDGRLFVTALTPLALWTTDWALARGRAWRFAVVAFVVSLLIYTPHLQLAYFSTWAITILAAFRLVQMYREGAGWKRVGRRLSALALAGFVGAFLFGAAGLWTPLRYLARYSQRVEKTTGAEAEGGYAYSTTWSVHPEEAFSLVVPEFAGVNLQLEGVNTYWGRNPFKLNHVYAGLVPVLLLPLAFLRRRKGEAWLFAGLALAALIYALGADTPFFHVFYWLIPGVRLFRAPDTIMFIFAISAVTGAALGLQALKEREGGDGWERSARNVTLYLWGAAALFLLLALLSSAGAFTDLWIAIFRHGLEPAKAAALEANLPHIQRGLWLTALLAGLVAGAWHLRRRGVIPQAAWIGAVIALSVLDLFRVSPQFIQVVDPMVYFPRDDVTGFLANRAREDEEPFRVYAVAAPYPSPNQFALYGVEQLMGHHGNELGRYQDMIDPSRLGAQDARILRLLNVRYIVSGRPLGGGLPEVFRGQHAVVYELPGAFERAFLVHEFEPVPDSLALDRLVAPEFDAARSVILDPEAADLLNLDFSSPQATETAEEGVRWLEHGVNEHVLEVQANGSALLVISANDYPAWRASVDGRETPVLTADYSLRAVAVSAGRHEVRLWYSSPLFRLAAWTSVLSILAGASLIAGAQLAARRRKRAAEPGINA
jgi:hypothetical protein